tara:strand:+ start:215 stop:667 length:453 start_codon:yes stop_codon:yes gene_type:complete
MKAIDTMKYGLLTSPESAVDNTTFGTNTYIDTQGYGHLRVLLMTGTCDAAIGSTAHTTAPLVEECDTTDGTYTDVTSAALADAIGATEDDSIFSIDVDLRKTHKRYMQVQAPDAGNGTTGCALCCLGILSEPDVHPSSATLKGLAELISA